MMAAISGDAKALMRGLGEVKVVKVKKDQNRVALNMPVVLLCPWQFGWQVPQVVWSTLCFKSNKVSLRASTTGLLTPSLHWHFFKKKSPP